jgi:serine acetyltransferase
MGRLRGDPRLALLVSQGMELGEGTHIASQVYIDGNRPWLITISDHVHLAPYSAIITHDASFHSHTGQTRIGRVVIGPRAYIGVGAILLPGTSIGADSVVGAGAVVHGDVPPESLVLGNPGKVTPAKVAVAWQRASAKKAPSWPREGWNLTTGITEERKREQREALADCADGYVPARTEPGSPFERSRAARSEG